MSSINDVAGQPDVLTAQVTGIELIKYSKTEKLNLFPQFLELNIYGSLQFPVLKAELLLHDPISLLVNFPMVGEETLKVTLKKTRLNVANSDMSDSHDRSAGNQSIEFNFMVSDIREIVPDDKARSAIYCLSLYHTEWVQNARWRVQRAYKDQYHNVSQSILKDYLNAQPQGTNSNLISPSTVNTANFEESKGTIPFYVPNMKPLEAITWMAKRAVPTNTKHNTYVFYQDFYGFNFKTIQSLTDMVNTKTYAYFSNMTPQQRNQATGDLQNLDQWTVSALKFNKRYSTTEKIAGGFFENEYYEIDIFNKKVNNSQTAAANTPANPISTNYKQLNTPQYLQDMRINNTMPGTKTRVRYAVGQNGGDDPQTPNYFKDKFGDAVRTQVSFGQISMTVAVPGHTDVQAGSVVELMIPELHGFNIVKEDKYVSGKYIVTDIKHTITVGMQHMMVMELARDSYTNEIAANSSFDQSVTKSNG